MTTVTFRRHVPPAVERWTLVVYVAVRVTVVVSAVLPPQPWQALSYWMVPPGLVLVGGICLRLAAIRRLGRYYTHRVAIQPDQTVVTSGPYRFVRHPAYAGMLAGNLGLVAFFHNPITLVAFAGLVVVLLWRISTEERALYRLPGYPDYARGRARLLPGVW
jgi:protein-S-isoprenylcysteine O-methyltransferase Ste14